MSEKICFKYKLMFPNLIFYTDSPHKAIFKTFENVVNLDIERPIS